MCTSFPYISFPHAQHLLPPKLSLVLLSSSSALGLQPGEKEKEGKMKARKGKKGKKGQRKQEAERGRGKGSGRGKGRGREKRKEGKRKGRKGEKEGRKEVHLNKKLTISSSTNVLTAVADWSRFDNI